NATPGSESHRAARALLEWQAESHASRELAPLDERIIAWEGSATVRTSDGRTVPYSRVGIEIAAERDRAQRLVLDEARALLVERELAPMMRERLERERDLVLSLDLASTYNSTFERLSGVSLGA